MVKNALGLIEVVGLAAGLEAADAAMKAANVQLLGYELTKGCGMVVIKLSGDVGAVKAAVDAAAAAAARVNKVCATHVIPRPQQQLGGIVLTKDTVGQQPAEPKPAIVPPAAEQAPVAVMPVLAEAIARAEAEVSTDSGPVAAGESVDTVAASQPAEGCNLCGDPACSRKKGDPRVICIHYDKNKEDE